MKRLAINTPGRAVAAVLCLAALGYGSLQLFSAQDPAQPAADPAGMPPTEAASEELFDASWEQGVDRSNTPHTADGDAPHEVIELREQRRRAIEKATELGKRYQNLGVAIRGAAPPPEDG